MTKNFDIRHLVSPVFTYARAFTLLAACMFLSLGAFAQTKSVTGTVFENDGKTPMIGVAVIIPGTSTGAVTDAKGSFRISAKEGDVLLFTFLGFDNKEVTVGSETNITVIMEQKAEQIDEVVVTALGLTRQQKALGYAVTTVDSETLTSTVSSNWLNAMAGKVAGLNFDSASAGPGGSIRVTLRGESSLSHDNNNALFVIDGVPIGSDMTNFGGSSYSNSDSPVDFGNGASDLNPDDIESVTVLKGPAATALYGSRAANGAIIITTKSGTTTKGIGVTVNSSVVFEKAGFWPDFQTEYGAGNANASNRAAANGDAARYYGFWTVNAAQSHDGQRHGRLQSRYGFGPRYEGQLFYTYDSYDFETETYTPQEWWYQDSYKGFFKSGVTYTNSVSIDGNNGKGSSARLSIKDVRNEWIVPNTGYTSQNVSLSVAQQMTSRIKMNAKVTYYRKNSGNLPTAGYDPSSPIHSLIWTVHGVGTNLLKEEWASGRIPEMIASGNGGSLINNGSGSARSENPYWLAHENLNTLDRNRVYGNASITADITNDITLLLRSGIDFNNDFATQRKPRYTYSYNDGYYREMSTNKIEFNNDFLLSYNREFGHLSVNANFGGNNMVYKYRNDSKTADKLDIEGIYALYNAAGELISRQTRREKSVNSLYGLISLGWKDTYFLDITGRNDWSSTLKKGNNSYFYPSLSASVLLDQVFELRESAPWINMLKVRGSWANVGNDTNPYSTDISYLNGTFSSSFYLPTSLQNPNLRPENVESWEAGIEAKLFQNRWTFDVAYYDSATTDQIISVPVETATGMTSQIINAGKVTNKGVEISTRVQAIKTKDFNWTINFNWSKNWNKLVSLADDVEVWQVNTNTVGSRVYIYAYPGTELGRVYGWGYARAPKGAFYYDESGNKVDCSGEVIVDASTGNPVVDKENQLDLGSIYPDWKGGMTHTFKYKNWGLTMSFMGQVGGKSYSVTHFSLAYQGKLKNTVPGRYEGLVHKGVNMNSNGTYSENTTITKDIVDYYNTYVYNRENAEMNTFDTSYLKFKELRVDYSLPSRICNQLGFIQGASVGFFATNLFCWSNWPQYDPDAAAMNGSSISRGIETAAYPMTRTYGVNVRLSF